MNTSTNSLKQKAAYLSINEAASYLSVSQSYLNKLRVYGGSPVYHKFGRKVVYTHDALDSWAQSRMTTSTSMRG